MNCAKTWLVGAITLACVGVACGAETPTATEPQGDDTLLSAERWQEDKYGLSLRPPLGSQLRETAGDMLLIIEGPAKSSTEVYLREMKSDAEVGQFLQMDPSKPNAPPTRVKYDNRVAVSLDMDSLVEIGLKQVEIAHAEASLLDQRRLEVGGHPAAVLYFNLPPDEQQRRWVLGHAYVLINDRAFAMLRLSAAQEDFASVRPAFEAVVSSVQVQEPAQRDKARQQQVQEGEQWRSGVGSTQYQQGLVAEQWLRLLDADKDIGWVRITQKHAVDSKTKDPGIRVLVQAHVVQKQQTLDSESDFFLSDDGEREVWSTKMTQRPLKPKETAKPAAGAAFVPPQESSVVDTGVRSGRQITLTRQDATSAKRYEWQTPPQGYLSQAELYLLPQFLPRRATPTMGFYAYYPNSGAISYRTVTVEAGKDGAYRVTVQPAPNAPQEVSLYDKNGRLIERLLPGGRRMVPADPQKLKAIWKQME